MSDRVSSRNLFVVTLAAAGLILVPVGMANAAPRELANSASTCRSQNVVYSDGDTVQIDGAQYECRAGHWETFGASTFVNPNIIGRNTI